MKGQLYICSNKNLYKLTIELLKMTFYKIFIFLLFTLRDPDRWHFDPHGDFLDIADFPSAESKWKIQRDYVVVGGTEEKNKRKKNKKKNK